MLTTVGDLVEDVIVAGGTLSATTESDVRHIRMTMAADTAASVKRRRGGSAANVAAAAGEAGMAARFIGHVGADYVGDHLISELERVGVDVVTQRGGSSATIIVILHTDGERSMITDRGSCLQLGEPQSGWLNKSTMLHVPLYSLAGGPLAETAATLIGWAHDRLMPVSLDASATSLLEAIGLDRAVELITDLRPSYLLANEQEASLLRHAVGTEGMALLAAEALIEKRGSGPVRIVTGDGMVEVPALDLGPVGDTTGAGDAFAAGFCTTAAGGGGVARSAKVGHRFAARHLRSINT